MPIDPDLENLGPPDGLLPDEMKDAEQDVGPYREAVCHLSNGRFHLLNCKLGNGQTAIVWQAIDTRRREAQRPDVAIKILRNGYINSSDGIRLSRIKSLRNSYRCLRAIHAQPVVGLIGGTEDEFARWLGVGETGSPYAFLALELLEGTADDGYHSLDKIVEGRHGYLSLDSIIAVCQAWASLMCYAHQSCQPAFWYSDHKLKHTFLHANQDPKRVKIIDFNEVRGCDDLGAASKEDVRVFCTEVLWKIACINDDIARCLYVPLYKLITDGMKGNMGAVEFRRRLDQIASAFALLRNNFLNQERRLHGFPDNKVRPQDWHWEGPLIDELNRFLRCQRQMIGG